MDSQLFCLVLSIVTLVQARSLDINEIVDAKLELMNRRAVRAGKTTLDLAAGSFYPVSYEGATAIGLDSLNRTGDCRMVFGKDSIAYSYQVGQLVHAVYSRLVTYLDDAGSGYYRAWDNSLIYSYTVHYNGGCKVRLDELEISLDDVEACHQSKCSSSKTDAVLANFVQKQLVPALNSKLASMSVAVEKNLKRVYCQSNSGGQTEEQVTKGLDVLKTFIFE